MDRPPALAMAFSRPGRALSTVLILIGALGLFSAFLATWVPGGDALFTALALPRDGAFRQPWRLFSSGLLTSPNQWSHLFFSLLGLYFLGAPLEKRWGAFRFVRFLAISVLFGNLATLAVNALPVLSQSRFHPDYVFGPAAAIAAIAVGWAREYPETTVNLFFFVPVRGKALLWITVGFCVLDLVYPAGLQEGVVAPFGGVAAGLLFAGTPSRLRSLWLRVRLTWLRRRGGLRSADLVAPGPPRRPRASAPPLRVVAGGLDEVLKKRTPPKDKRYLN